MLLYSYNNYMPFINPDKIGFSLLKIYAIEIIVLTIILVLLLIL